MKNTAAAGNQRRLARPAKRFRRAAFRLLLLTGMVALPSISGAQGVSVDERVARVFDSKLEPNEPAETAAGLGVRGRWVNVVQFRFTGNTLFASKALAAVLAGDLNRPLDFSELHALTHKVADFYRAHGARALVVVPAQDISSRKVTFVVVEALPGKLPMEAYFNLNTPAKRVG